MRSSPWLACSKVPHCDQAYEHRQDFRVVDVVLEKALRENSKNRRNRSVQYCAVHSDCPAQSPGKVRQNLSDEPEQRRQRRDPAVGGVLQVKVMQMSIESCGQRPRHIVWDKLVEVRSDQVRAKP